MKQTFFISALIIIIDQFTKYWVVWHLNLKEVLAIDVLPPYLNFRMAWNEGVNFGLLSHEADWSRWALILLALVICGWVIYWGRQFKGFFASLLMGLIIGGAIGNVIDRVIHGAVVDFLNMSCCGINNPYAFNVADIAVFAGAIGLILFSERLPKHA